MKKILSIILSISMTLGLFVSPVFANESDVTSEPAVSTESSQLEVNGEDSAGQMIADAITEQAAEQNSDSTCSISSLTIDKASMTAEVSFVTDEDAELLVSIFSEDRKTLKASGRQQVTTAEHNATIPISCRVADSSLSDTFVGEAYLLDKDTHAPLCDSFVTNEYTKEITDLKKSTINDFEADRVLNLDNDTETNFAVYNDGVNVIEETFGKNQIIDNGDGTYTVTNADSTFTSLKSGDKLSYTDSDGNVLLLTVQKITVDGSTVTIWKETKEEDLTDYFAYLKIETTDQNGALDIDKSTMDEGVTFLGSNLETQSETAAVGASGEGSLSHSLSFQIKEKLASSEDAAKKLDISAELKIQWKTTLNYYLSGTYQSLTFKMEYSTSVSAGMTGKMEKKYRLVRVELPVLPGINVGFTPSFVVRATGNTKWTGEWKGIIGFAYDTTNGGRDAGEAPTTTSKVEISATLFVGVEATPYVCIMTEDLCKASLETSAGIELKGTQSKDSDETKIHKCDECTAGSVKCKVSAKLKLEVVKSTATVEANLVSLEVKLFDFYYSRTYNEFGYDSCPHIYYKTKLSLKDKKGQAVPDAWITPMKIGDNGPAAVKFLVDKDTPETTSVAAGTDGTSVIYLPKGKYVLHAKTDDLIGEKTAEIKKRANYTHEVSMTMNTRTYPVTVTVQDESGNPVSGATFEEKNLETGKTTSVDGKTNAKGQAELQLALGTHTLEARTDTTKGSGEITVTKDTNALTITMAEIKYGTVNLTAVDGEGNAVAGASISGANLSAFLVTDSSGKSSFKAEVGLLAIHVKKDKASGDAELDVKEGEQDVTVVLADFYSLTVHAVDEYGNPVENAVVSGLNKEVEPRTDVSGMAEMTIPEGTQCIQIYTDTLFEYKHFYTIAEDTEVTVTLKESNFFWTLNGGELRIFGEGEMPGYTYSHGAPWTGHFVQKATIEDGITNVGSYAFNANQNLESVSIPDSVTTIGHDAFWLCSSLTSVHLPDGITSIGSTAFEKCYNLKEINIPKSVTEIGNYAFMECPMESLDIPNGTKRIGKSAFASCKQITSLSIPDSVTYIGEEAFEYMTGLESIDHWSENVTYISAECFRGCTSLYEVNIPKNVTSIVSNAFQDCTKLKTVKSSGEITYIGNKCFSGCTSLSEINILNSVTEIYEETFKNCSSLKNITLPDTVKEIEQYAFGNCSSLENIFIPDSVTKCSSYAFSGCTNLKSISAPETMVISYDTFYGCNATITWRTVASSAGTAFSDSPDDESIEITPEEASSENADQPEVVFDDEYIEDSAEDDSSADVDIISETDDEAGFDTTNEFADGAEAAEEVTTVLEKNITEDQSAVISDPWTQRTENNLVPGEKYILIWARKENEDVSLSANDVYYTQQKTADEQGTIQFKYPMIGFTGSSVPQIFIFGPSTENNLIDAEVQIASLTEAANWQSPEIQVSYKGKVLTEDTDYRVYGDTYVKEAGEYSILIKGCGDYNGRIRAGYTVKAAEKPSEKPSEPEKPNPSEPDTPADHTHKYRVTYRWQNISDGEKKCMITWNCTVENCSHRVVADATVTRTGDSCTGYSYQATGVLDGVTYTNTNKTLGSGHSWTSWQTVSAATVTQPEKQTRRCQNCGIIGNRNNGSALKPTMKINASSFPMKVKQTTTKLKVTGLAAGDRVVSWTSSNPKILTVSKKGKLKAGKKTGKVTVTVRLASGLTKQVRITVQKKTVKTTKISLSPAKITLKKGKKQTLKPVITPITSQQKTTYSSNNKKVVSVNSKGQITAKKKGTAKITIRSGNKKKVVTVTVK
ncbi:leucine-rich repeat protein [Lachnospiraceae bacterium SGI.066]